MSMGIQTEKEPELPVPALPPYTPRPEPEIARNALERAHPKLLLPSDTDGPSGSGLGSGSRKKDSPVPILSPVMSLAKTAEWADMYAGLCSEVGIRCEVLEEALKVRQEEVIRRLNEGESLPCYF